MEPRFLISSYLLLQLFTSSHVYAMGCPSPPAAIAEPKAADVSLQIKALKQFIGEAGFSVKLDKSVTNVYEKYPNADRLVLAQLITSQFCELLNESKDLSSQEKFRLFIENRDKILSLTPTEKPKEKSTDELIEILKGHASKILSNWDVDKENALKSVKANKISPGSR